MFQTLHISSQSFVSAYYFGYCSREVVSWPRGPSGPTYSSQLLKKPGTLCFCSASLKIGCGARLDGCPVTRLPPFNKIARGSQLTTCQADAEKWLPTNYKLSKDIPNGRWLVKGLYFTVSRSFLKYGEVRAFAVCCWESWKFQDSTKPCPHQWVIDLVKDLKP